ncbi:MAG: DUF3160 domain-containing protein [Armatimonadetes bacterium]|nr:DUF3160 domain-containing protein [Armatimonadota bacterium]
MAPTTRPRSAPAGRDVGVRVDFTQFIVRGHYTRTPELGQYFRAMMWLGLVPRPLGPGVPECTVRSLLLTHQLVGDDEARGLWRRVYEPTAFMVGVADDLTHEDLQPFLRRCFDPERIDSFGEQERLEAFWKLTPTMRQQGIEAGAISYKIMGQRFILDSRVFRETVAPRTGRGFPLGLDVPAVLGSARAIGLLDDLYQQPKFDGYATQRAKMRAEVVALSPSDWDQNLYYGWLRALQPLLEPKGPGWPRFMQSPAWLDKQLVCFLGSWTELRHDTILYAKQSTSECGGSEPEPPAPPLGYVEPEVAVYERLARLLRMSRDGLADLGLLGKKGGGDDNAYTGQQLAEQFGEFATMLDWLAEVSRKELAGQPLSKDDLRGIEYYGGQTERLMLTVVGLATTGRPASYWNLESRADRNMALVADVHTSGPYALTEAVGQPAELWVIVNHGGKLVAARGATFTWYEFKVKTTERMTDEQWQKRLRDGKAEPMPSWTSSVFIGPGVKTRTTETERRIMNTGC